jgi:hypothetical protein
MKKIRGDEPIGIIVHTYMKISQGNSLSSYLYLKLKCHVSCFYLFSFSSYKIREQESGRNPSQRGKWHSGRRDKLWKGDRRVNMVQ